VRKLGFATVALLAGCHQVFGLSFDHPDAAPEDGPADGPRSAYAEAVLHDQPIGYWRFSASSPVTAIDLAGQAPGLYTGNAAPTAIGALPLEDDRAVALDGTGDYVDMGARFGFPGTQAFTIEAWVKPDMNGVYNGLVSKDDESAGGNTRIGYHMYTQASAFGFERNDGITSQDVRTGALTTSRWTHVAVAYDGASLSLYTDGVRQAITAGSNVLLPVTTNAFVVGARNGGKYLFLKGGVDELAVYDKALTDEQLAAHHVVGLGQ
jgi:Concanavalin A-like lectin/glucanases superfamily